MSRFMAIVVATCAVAACSGHAPAIAGPHAVDARNACHNIGLGPNDSEYFDCVGSLEQTAAQLDAQARADQAGAECSRQKLQPGTAAFAHCVLDRTTANP